MNKQRITDAIKSMNNLDELISITESEHESVRMAISALEKQIPKKPCEVVDESGWEDWACPECGALIEGGSVMLHCWSCGQKLDWRVKE